MMFVLSECKEVYFRELFVKIGVGRLATKFAILKFLSICQCNPVMP